MLAMVAAALAFAMATWAGTPPPRVGLLAGYAVVWEIGARIVMEIVGTEQPGRWMLSSYLAAWMNGHIEEWEGTGPYTTHWWHAGLVFGVLLAVVVGGAFVHSAAAIWPSQRPP